MKAVWWWIGYGVWGLVLALVLGVQGVMAADQAQTTRVSIAAMYVAFFERAPDDDGLTFWEVDAAQSGLSAGALMRKLATGFAHHPSFTELYGALDDGEFVDAIYLNVGGALPDAEGRQFWLSQIQSGDLTRPEFVADFVFGLLNLSEPQLDELLAQGDITEAEHAGALLRKNRLTYRAEVGLAFTATLGSAANLEAGTDPLDPQSLAVDPVYQAAQKMVSGVSDAVATRNSALAYLAGMAANPSIAAINTAALADIFGMTEVTGRLQVTLEPAAAITAGAQWRRANTNPWFNSGSTETGIPVGGQTVEFQTIPEWTAPNNAAVSITAGQTTTLTRSYNRVSEVETDNTLRFSRYSCCAASITSGDFNGDGYSDLAVIRSSPVPPAPVYGRGGASVFLGDGTGGFSTDSNWSVPAATYPFDPTVDEWLTWDPKTIASGDLSGNGVSDLILGGLVIEQNQIYVLLSQGDGQFDDAISYLSPNNSENVKSIAVADVNNDGFLDVVIANRGQLIVFLGNGDGTLQVPPMAQRGISPHWGQSLAVGDFNNNGYLDIAVAASGIILIMLGNGDGTFVEGSWHRHLASGYSGLVTGDFTGNGHLDIAFSSVRSNAVQLLVNNGQGHFMLAADQFSVGASPSDIVAADFNGNGRLDIATVNTRSDSVSLLLSNGDGTFQPARTFLTGREPVSLTVADFDMNGLPDVAVLNRVGSSIEGLESGFIDELSGSITLIMNPGISK